MMNGGEIRGRRRLDPAAVGAGVWSATVAAVIGGIVDLTIFQVLLVLGPLVVVPLGRPLVTGRTPAPHEGLVTIGAFAVLLAVLVAPGAGAGALTLPWLAVTGALTVTEARRRWRERAPTWDGRLDGVLRVGAPAWLVVGAISLTASRAQVTFLGLSPELIELGAVHFSFAGFAATALAGCVVHRSPHRALAASAAAGTVGGAGLVLVGHLTIRPFELAGAIAMTLGVLLVGTLGWSLAPPRTAARVLLRLAALSVVVPMAFALHYAWALTTGSTHLPYETIARIHGTLNAFGFSIGGLVGWRLAARLAHREAASWPALVLVEGAASSRSGRP